MTRIRHRRKSSHVSVSESMRSAKSRLVLSHSEDKDLRQFRKICCFSPRLGADLVCRVTLRWQLIGIGSAIYQCLSLRTPHGPGQHRHWKDFDEVMCEEHFDCCLDGADFVTFSCS